jgi:hypothetical protein
MPTISGEVLDATGTAVAGRVVRAYRRDTGAFLGSAVSREGADASFSSVALLLHCDGANASTTFTDVSTSPKTVTAVGNAQVSTAQGLFGSQSAVFDGNGDYLQVTNNTDFVFGTGDFCVELWVRMPAQGHVAALVDYFTATSGWQIYVTSAGLVAWYQSNPNVTALTGTTAINDNNWHHVAVARSGTTLRLFVDGVVDASGTNSKNHADPGAALGIGAQIGVRNATYDLDGFVDEVRLTKGVARYTGAFTPPVAPFSEAATVLGSYALTTAHTGECNVLCLDDAAGTVYNDLVLRTTPV